MPSLLKSAGLLLAALLHIAAVQGLDSCKSQTASCVAVAASPSASAIACGSQGTVKNPKTARPPCSHRSLEACRDLCFSFDDCLAFSFNPSTGECNIYTDFLTDMGYTSNGSSPQGRFFHKDCFEYNCGLKGSVGSSCPAQSASTVTKTVSKTGSAIVYTQATTTVTVTDFANSGGTKTVTVTGSAFGTGGGTKTITISEFPSSSAGAHAATVTKTVVSTDYVNRTKTVVSTDVEGTTVVSTERSVQTIVNTNTVVDTVINTDFVTKTLTSIDSIFATATDIITDSVFATRTATVDVNATTTVTDTLSASTVTVSASPTPQAIDINGCPAIGGSNDGGGYKYECGVTYGPDSITIGTNPGFNIIDCASQCFFNTLGGDCLGATFHGGSFDNLGQAVAGICTLYEFPSGRVQTQGYAAATFEGF